MNAEITDKVANELLKWVQSTGEFVSEQAPDVANQIVTYGIVSNSVGVICCITLTSAAIYAFYRAAKRECENTYAEWPGPTMICSAVAGFVTVLLGGIGLHNLILAFFAPKLYIIEYISNLVK